ncbi:hypothetical protein RclHR1_10320003 [Rhizophagus clarus]|nr:hypothetical protein RclHR1_10320003 [Rhizophagus clarus]
MIAYFESWKDLQNIISKESFWNGIKLNWCHYTVPSFITRRKNSQQSLFTRQDKPNKLNQDPPSKHTNVSSEFKTGSPVIMSNHVFIRNLQKDLSQSLFRDKPEVKNK